MRKRLLVLIALVMFYNASFAQMSGTSFFLQGKWLEIGQIGNGALGACTPTPAGYHAHPAGGLAEVYDWGHDGWAVGAPNYMGDYTVPGTPFEGWELQIGAPGTRNQAFQGNFALTCPGTFPGGGGSLTGSNVSYSNSGGRIIGNWAGTAAGGNLQINTETRVDTFASWVVFTTRFHNRGAAAINDIYYMRQTDPDNDETWPGGAFNTNNMVDYQNDVDHRVQVRATGISTTAPPFALCTKDCRAVCFIYNSWPLAVGTDISAFWNMVSTGGGSFYNIHANHPGDIAIGLIYKIPTIAAGDSAVISYAYTFNGLNGVDSAFPEPLLVVNGIGIPPSGPAPAPTYDTFNACGSGLTTIPVRIDFASDKCWTWSTWTWAPATGLSSTTGVSNTINFGSLPPVITYTITGTDSSVNMLSCNHRVMYLTIRTCNGATVNSPCIGDPLNFNAPGDSTAATYVWYGPAPATTILATTQSFTITPSVWADTGVIHVIKTVGGIPDTNFVTVVIHPQPVLNLTSSIALCGALADSLVLGVTPDSVGEVFSWTGPGGFTSSNQFPVINPFDSTMGGTYTVDAVTSYGCRNSNNISVYPGITPGFTYNIVRGCFGDVVTFTNTTINATTYSWNFGDGSPAVTTRNCTHTFPRAYAPAGIWTVTLTLTNAHCNNSVSQQVDTRHTVTADFLATPDTFCAMNPSQSTTMINNSNATVDTAVGVNVPGLITGYAWDFGDGITDIVPAPTHSYVDAGVYRITLVVTDSIGCKDTTHHDVVALRVDINSWHDTTLCLRQPLPLNNVITVFPNVVPNDFTYSWVDTPPNLDNTSVQIPNLSGYGVFQDILTATLNTWGCFAIDTMNIHSVLGALLTNVTPNTVIPYGSSLQLNSDNELYYHWVPNDGSIDNPIINNPIVTPTQTTIYTVYGMDQYGCVDSAFITVTVDSTLHEFIPSAFTPNGDGLNDVFRPGGITYQRVVDFRVYNRWGQQVFQSSDYKKGWDGTWNGVPQDLGVYHYVVIIAKPGGADGQGINIVYKGDVTLIR